MNHYQLSDIYQVYIKGLEEAGDVVIGKPLPLDKISCDLSSFDSSNIEQLEDAVKDLIERSGQQRNSTKPDPLAALFQNLDRDFAAGETAVTRKEYEQFEKTRVNDKWRGNRIGSLNELIATLPRRIALSSAGQLDLVVMDENNLPIAIVEMKNRWNTMNSSSAIRLRREIERHVLTRGSTFHNCKGLLVERIPKVDGEASHFSPSDPSTGEKTPDNANIQKMGLQQFLSQFAGDQLAYMKGIVIIAQTMVEEDALPADYDMTLIFELLAESLS
ncbi:hypothetical protein JCM19240_3618 [Vibrio maritimus]|uniref:Uncharacterized protein n=1 Tax=Vibrio maritimus TaxID=990268 RepID=A0A090T7M8_9VIBR|nr:hypothetical protein JCM19240_3618 [Vibrio maritimus]